MQVPKISKILIISGILSSLYSQAYPYSDEDQSSFYLKLDAAGNVLPANADKWVMVRDNLSGLIWEVKENKDGIKDYANLHDADNTYTWCNTNYDPDEGDIQGACTATDTEDFIDSLNKGSGYCGYTDWRLPTIRELVTLANHSRNNPAINTAYFPMTVPANYWTSTTYAGNVVYAWFVHFDNASSDSFNKTNSFYVRAVRGRNEQPITRFSVQPDGTVIDKTNGLQWQQATADITGDGKPDNMSWQEAIDYADNLSLGGYDDWRLPDIDELLTLPNYSYYHPAAHTTIFNTESFYYWSAQRSVRFKNKAWRVYFGNGYDSCQLESYKHFVRAVRGEWAVEEKEFDIYHTANISTSTP